MTQKIETGIGDRWAYGRTDLRTKEDPTRTYMGAGGLGLGALRVANVGGRRKGAERVG